MEQLPQKIKTLKIIHLGICAGTIMAYVFLGDFSFEILKTTKIDTSSVIYLAIPIVALLLSNFLFKNRINQIDPKSDIQNKLDIYQVASLSRWAILEGGAIAIIILKPEIFIFGLLLILYLLFLRPTEEKIKQELQHQN